MLSGGSVIFIAAFLPTFVGWILRIKPGPFRAVVAFIGDSAECQEGNDDVLPEQHIDSSRESSRFLENVVKGGS